MRSTRQDQNARKNAIVIDHSLWKYKGYDCVLPTRDRCDQRAIDTEVYLSYCQETIVSGGFESVTSSHRFGGLA